MRFSKLKIGMRLIAMMLGIAWSMSLLNGTLSSAQLYSTMHQETQLHYEAIRDIKTESLLHWYEERSGDIVVLANNTDVQNIHRSVYSYRRNMQVGDKEAIPVNTPEYEAIWKSAPLLEMFTRTYGYYDMFLISATNGHVLYSVGQEADLGANLRWGSLKDSGLAECWNQVVETKEVYLTDFSHYAPSGNEPAQFIGAPLFFDNTFQGAVVLQIPLDQLNHLMQDSAGMGSTGETYLVGADYKLRNDSFLQAKSGNEHTVLELTADTDQTRRGLNGETGYLAGNDYEGVPVLSAYGYVDLPNQRYAIISEVYESEAYAPLRKLMLANGVVILALSVLAFFLVVALSKTISVPLKRITEDARLMASGDFSQTIGEISGQDEISVMTSALSIMQGKTLDLISELKANNEELEQQSEELAASNEELEQQTAEALAANEELELQSEKLAESNEQLEQQSEELSASNEELEQQSEELSASNEELEQQSEELSASNEELEQQSEELSASNEELDQQSKELSASNEELDQQREELKQNVAELEVTNIKAKAVQVSALDCIVGMNHEGQITEFNPAAEETFGYTRDEAIGLDLAEAIIPPELREKHRMGLERYLRSGRGQMLGERIEITAMKKDGTVFPVELAITASFAGDRHFFTAYLRDISERKQQEQQIKMAVNALEDEVNIRKTAESSLIDSVAELKAQQEELVAINDELSVAQEEVQKQFDNLNNLPTPVFQIDTDFSVLYINPTGASIAGHTPETALGKKCYDLFKTPHCNTSECRSAQAMNKGIVITAENVIRRGSFDLPIRYTSAPVKDAQGKIVGALEYMVDITETKIAENALIDSVEELANSNKELEDFAYIASHDLKEPLRGISNYATFLNEDYADRLDEDGIRMLETLPRLTKRLEKLIDDLLYFSRVGRLELAKDDVDLDNILDSVVESIHIRLVEEGVEIRRPRPLPETHCDGARIAEVFRNLITNAMKYNDKDGKWIEIGWQDDLPDHQGDVFYVRDNGIGIPEKHYEKVFTMFKRLHARDKYGGGTGAGMTIVKKIISRHNGKIWLESKVGEGTTFYFTLNRKWD